MSETSETKKSGRSYAETIAAINADESLSSDERVALRKQAAEQEYGSKAFDINQFEELLGRLEGSKLRQQRQKSVEGRRDIFAGGLAGMMSNF
jgi:hypothetical protein